MNKLAWAVVGLLLLGLVFLLVDCSCGKTRFFECLVCDHEYKAPWTEVETTTDSEGHARVVTRFHSEEYHVICRESGGSLVFDCQTDKTSYFDHADGQQVTVRTRVGRWTGGHYLPVMVD